MKIALEKNLIDYKYSQHCQDAKWCIRPNKNGT